MLLLKPDLIRYETIYSLYSTQFEKSYVLLHITVWLILGCCSHSTWRHVSYRVYGPSFLTKKKKIEFWNISGFLWTCNKYLTQNLDRISFLFASLWVLVSLSNIIFHNLIAHVVYKLSIFFGNRVVDASL